MTDVNLSTADKQDSTINISDSTYIEVNYVQVVSAEDHPNADRLDIVRVQDAQREGIVITPMYEELTYKTNSRLHLKQRSPEYLSK